MARAWRLALDGVRVRRLQVAVLCLQVLAASLVVGQALFVAGEIKAAATRLHAFTPLGEWYQLSDASSPAEFERMAASPDFEGRLRSLFAWLRASEDVELVVLPKTAISVGDAAGAAQTLYLVSANLPSYFDLEVVRGEWPNQAPEGATRPVVVGASLGDRYGPGDVIAEGYEVAAILAPGARCFDIGAGMQPLALDDLMLTPIDAAFDDAGTLDGIMNAPVVRFRTGAARDGLAAQTTALGLYEYRFWRLDHFLGYYTADLRRRILLEAGATVVVLGYALSAFVLGVLRSIASRRREYGVHLAYGASHADFWRALLIELGAVVAVAFALPLALLHPPLWWAAVLAFAALAVLLAALPVAVLRRRSIPDLMRGTD